MTKQELKDRTMEFAVDVWRFTTPMRMTPASRHVAHQLFRAATGLAANYRSACLGRSREEFAAKLGIVREESDESVFWLEFVQKTSMASEAPTKKLLAESRELAAISAAAYKTTKASLKRERKQRE
jgi:four helix bundle protein